MRALVRIGTRESQLAAWQATLVKDLLAENHIKSELVFIKSEGDLHLQTPLYEMGVQGVFTRSLDQALLNNRIDIAVHSLKDVPTQMASGIIQAAVLKRGNAKDLLLLKSGQPEDPRLKLQGNTSLAGSGKETAGNLPRFIVATGSLRRKAQWLNRYPQHLVEPLRGNLNTRLKKLKEGSWDGAIFAAAGLERIGLRPEGSIELDWMLPAPSQGAIMVACLESDLDMAEACRLLNDEVSKTCAGIEREFLRTLMGGCSTPIGALAEIEGDEIFFRGNILSPDGREKAEVEKVLPLVMAVNLGKKAAEELLTKGGARIIELMQDAEN